MPVRDRRQTTSVDRIVSLLTTQASLDYSPSDVPTLITTARAHRVELEVLDRLIKEGVELPSDVIERNANQRLVRRARRLREARILTALQETIHVPFVVVKGPVIAGRWSDDPIQRDYSDLDILIRRQDFATTVDALTSAGFDSPLSNWHGFARHGVAEIPLRRDGVDVDLHWDIVATASHRATIRFDIDQLLERANPVTIDGQILSTLDDVDTLIHLCVNAGLDGAQGLRQLLDIHRMVSGGVPIGDQLVERARCSGSAALCAAVLQRCVSVMGTDVAEGRLRELEPWRGWLAINRLSDRFTRRLVASDSVASGVVLSAGRSSRRSTLIAIGVRTRESLRTHLLGRQRTDPGGELDWQRQPPAGNVSSSRRTYLAWVDRADDLSAKRWTDAGGLEALLQPFEPRATPLLGAALSAGLRGRRSVAYVIEHPDGRPAAALVGYRWSVGGRTGYPLLLDEAAAVPIARLIDRLGITDLGGFDQDLRPLRPLLRRWEGETTCSAAMLRPGFRWGAPPSNTRRGEHRDIDSITHLMWSYSPHGFANRWLLRRRVRRAIDELVVVTEAGDPPRIVGVAARDSATTTFHCWAHIVIDPAHREQRHSWDLVAAAAAAAGEAGAGLLGFAVSSNPMPIPDDAFLPQDWCYSAMATPNRLPGERSVRTAVGAILQIGAGRRDQASPEFRTPGAGDNLLSDRRTQSWWARHSGQATD